LSWPPTWPIIAFGTAQSGGFLQVNLRVKQHPSGHTPAALLARLRLGRLRTWTAQLKHGFRQGALLPQSSPPAIPGCSFSAKQASFELEERKLLLQLARTSLLCAVSGSSEPTPLAALPSKLLEQHACFVTLTQAGMLRGCMGNLLPRAALYQTVTENTRNAALRDPRFPPLEKNELGEVQIEITVLSQLEPLRYNSVDELLNQLQPGEHGVFLQLGASIATFLPQVWEQVPDRIQFLDRLAQKCGGSSSAWREKDAQLCVYYAEYFSESIPALQECPTHLRHA
jgi:AmmeMemoRadiSam system protein A